MGQVRILVAGVCEAVEQGPSGGGAAGSLPGARSDVASWRHRLRAMGVPTEDLRTLCSPQLTRAAFLEALEAQAGATAQEADGQLLLIISAHGGPGALFFAQDGPVSSAAVVEVLDRQLRGRRVTLVLDTCPPAGSPSEIPQLRPQDRLLLASDGAHPAEEHHGPDGWHGAFTWAMGQVLDRWASVGPHGALVPISARLLVEQASLVLRGLGYAQVPLALGAELDAPLLGGGQVTPAPLPVGATRQIDPGNPHGFKVYEIQPLGGGTRLGSLIVTGPTWSPPFGTSFAADQEVWTITPPSSGFRLVPTTENLPAFSGTRYEHVAFNPMGGKSNYQITGIFEIEDSSGALQGYMKTASGQLDWYMSTSTITSYFQTSSYLDFAWLSGSVSFSAQYKASPKI